MIHAVLSKVWDIVLQGWIPCDSVLHPTDIADMNFNSHAGLLDIQEYVK